MARTKELYEIAKKFNLKFITIKDLIEYRLKNESLITEEVEVKLPTDFGDFKLKAFKQITNNQLHLAIYKGSWTKDENILVRVHSSCVTGDIFGSCRCDCGPQLHAAMEQIESEGKGILVYMNQEGRGIGLLNKLKAYEIQESGKEIQQYLNNFSADPEALHKVENKLTEIYQLARKYKISPENLYLEKKSIEDELKKLSVSHDEEDRLEQETKKLFA